MLTQEEYVQRAQWRRFTMPKMVGTHSVVDVDRWPAGKAERAALIGRYATNVTEYVAADGSNDIAVTADVHDLDGLRALVTSPSPEGAAAQERHDVIQRITAHFGK